MKLFFQLTTEQQSRAVSYCADLVIGDAIESGLDINPSDEEGVKLKAQLDELMEEFRETQFSSEEEKIEFLMGDEIFSNTVLEISLEMAKDSFYHEDDELSINLVDLEDEHVCSDCADEEVETKEDSTETLSAEKKALLN